MPLSMKHWILRYSLVPALPKNGNSWEDSRKLAAILVNKIKTKTQCTHPAVNQEENSASRLRKGTGVFSNPKMSLKG